jgi:Mn-dependent DtxR family transcriptional regulator
LIVILEKITQEIEKEDGPITVKELARRLDVEESALEGMLEFLEKKGRLSVYRPGECDEHGAPTCVSCIYRKECPVKDKGVGR